MNFFTFLWKKQEIQIGRKAESAAVKYLKGEGYKILETNFRSRYGEIDIIAEKDNILIFFEVKARSKDYIPPEAYVNKTKIRKIIKTAKYYLIKKRSSEYYIRFDVLSVVLPSLEVVRHLKDAFSLYDYE